MDDAFIAPGGTDITDAFRMYLRPLLGSQFPETYRLRGAPVARMVRGAHA
jgi:6-phosphofructokinase 1